MKLINIENLILSRPSGALSPIIQLELLAGDSVATSSETSEDLLSYILGHRSIHTGTIDIVDLALIAPPPPGLDHLKTADFLRTIFLLHYPEEWEGFRPRAMQALHDLKQSHHIMSMPLGKLSLRERMSVEYISLSLKPWSSLILADPNPTDEQMAYARSMGHRSDKCLLHLKRNGP